MKILKFTIFFLLCSLCVNAQTFKRPWKSYKPVKPQIPYKSVDYLNKEYRQIKCNINGQSYEPSEFLTKWDINQDKTFQVFKYCCEIHPSRCVSNYIGSNDKTLLYTMVEKKAYRYMEWILNDGFVYDADIDTWGIYNEVDGIMVPLRNYNPMMLACKNGDLKAAKILRERGAYLSQPANAIGMTPYAFAKRYYATSSKEFNDYIEREYKEETTNIKNKKPQYGTTFSDILIKELREELENNLLQNEQKIIEKVNLLNKA